MVREQLFGRHIHHVDLLPVGTAALDGVSHVFAVVRETHTAKRDSAVVRQFVRVQQHLWLAVESVLHIIHTLVLQAIILAVEIFPKTLPRNAIAFIISDLR